METASSSCKLLRNGWIERNATAILRWFRRKLTELQSGLGTCKPEVRDAQVSDSAVAIGVGHSNTQIARS